VAHILEHVTLCGSHRYPVRDPFFNMLKRSLNTFMNAWTASDHTSYPFSTQNAKDYANLTGVYLDAVFNPLLDRFDFLQEGHRFAFPDQPSPASPCRPRRRSSSCEIHGVVYNEMKGAMSDPQAAVSSGARGGISIPTTTYRHNSGGAPAQHSGPHARAARRLPRATLPSVQCQIRHLRRFAARAAARADRRRRSPSSRASIRAPTCPTSAASPRLSRSPPRVPVAAVARRRQRDEEEDDDDDGGTAAAAESKEARFVSRGSRAPRQATSTSRLRSICSRRCCSAAAMRPCTRR
jgi:hypothetical protein